MENKKNTFSVVIITILIIAVIGLSSYIVYDRINSSKEDEKTEINYQDSTKNTENNSGNNIEESKFYNIIVKNTCSSSYNEDCIGKTFDDFVVDGKNYKITFTKENESIYFNFGKNKIELINQTIETISLMDDKYLVLGIDPTGGYKFYIYDLNLDLKEEVGDSLGDVLNEKSSTENWILDKYNLIYKTCEDSNKLTTYNLHFENGSYNKTPLSILTSQCSSQR